VRNCLDGMVRAGQAVHQDAAADEEHRRGADHREGFHKGWRGAQNAVPQLRCRRAKPAPACWLSKARRRRA